MCKEEQKSSNITMPRVRPEGPNRKWDQKLSRIGRTTFADWKESILPEDRYCWTRGHYWGLIRARTFFSREAGVIGIWEKDWRGAKNIIELDIRRVTYQLQNREQREPRRATTKIELADHWNKSLEGEGLVGGVKMALFQTKDRFRTGN